MHTGNLKSIPTLTSVLTAVPEKEARSVATYCPNGSSKAASVGQPKVFAILSSSVEVTFKTNMMEALLSQKKISYQRLERRLVRLL